MTDRSISVGPQNGGEGHFADKFNREGSHTCARSLSCGLWLVSPLALEHNVFDMRAPHLA